MFLLVTGSSGMGKTTVREALAPRLEPGVECLEFSHIVEFPEDLTIAWRQRSVEAVIQRCLSRQAEGRHLFMAGDPVAAGEVLAAPSATGLDAIAICLLHADPDVQRARLEQRGDPAELIVHHIAFAAWMRQHMRDPQYRQDVIMDAGWKAMQWHRWQDWWAGDPRWSFHEIDTSALTPIEVARRVHDWCLKALTGEAPVLTHGWCAVNQ